MSDTEKAWTTGQVREMFVCGREQRKDFTGINNSRAEFERWLAAHDHEVMVDYEKRRKPDPIHIDNIDGQRADQWLATHDAEQREAGRLAALEKAETFTEYGVDVINDDEFEPDVVWISEEQCDPEERLHLIPGARLVEREVHYGPWRSSSPYRADQIGEQP